MARIFGHAWTSRYGETDDGMWAAVIGPMSRDQVKGGLRHMLNDWTDSFPPTPAQFRAVAVTPGSQVPVPRGRRIGVVPASDEVVSSELSKMRAMFGGAK